MEFASPITPKDNTFSEEMQMDMISKKLANDRLYAYHGGRFWFWDEGRSIWKESHLLAKKYNLNHEYDKLLTPEDFLSDPSQFQALEDYEVDYILKNALQNAQPCKNAPIDPVEEDSSSGVPASCICSTCTCGGCKEECFGNCHSCGHPVQECNSYQTEGEKHLTPAHSADVAKPEVPGTQTTQNKPLTFIREDKCPAFDYSGLTDQTVEDLHFAEDEYRHGKQMAERGLVHMGNAIAAAHDALCGVVAQCDNGEDGARLTMRQARNNQHSEDTFKDWCLSVGVTKPTAYRLLQVSALMAGSSPRQRAILEALPPTLLYAVAKPSAPAELVEKVKNGEVSTNKEYQDLLAQLKAEKSRADTAEAHLEAAHADISGLKDRATAAEAREEEAWSMVSKAQDEAKAAQENLDYEVSQNDALHEEKGQLLRECEAAKQARAEAEARAHKAEDALKHQPIAGVVDEEEVDRRAAEKAWGLADARNRELQEENDRLKKNSAQLERRMKAMTSRMDDLGQIDFETANHCPEAMLAIWNSCKGSYSRLTGEDLENTFQYICNTLNSIRQEAALLCRQPEGYDGGAA